MPRYLLLLRNDAMAARRMLQTLTVGEEEFPGGVARFGGTTIGVFAVSGRYDAALVVDFEDEAACLAFTLAATAEGQYVESLRVYERDDLRRAEDIARRASELFDEDALSQQGIWEASQLAALLPAESREDGGAS